MNIKVCRDTWTAKSTSGVLSIDGENIGFTLERPEPRFPSDVHCIQAGIFPVSLYESPHFGRLMPLLDVPGHTGIEIHWGDFPQDSRGCVLVGTKRTADAIWNTREMFEELYYKIQQAILTGEQCTVTVAEAMTVTDPEIEM